MDEDTRLQMLRAALAAAALMERADDPANLQRLEALTALHKGRIAPTPTDASPAQRLATLTYHLAPEIDSLWLPVLTRHLGQVLAGHAAADAPDAVRTAAAIAVLARTAGPHGEGRAATREALAQSYRHVRLGAERVYDVISEALASPDAPDVAGLSREMLRLEAARFVAETLGDRKAATEFAYISRRIARIALNRAASTIDAFLAERDLMRLFDNAAVLGPVDDMMALALRVLDAKAAQEEEVTAFVEPADQAALTAFVDSLDRLAAALLLLAGRAAAGKSGETFFTGLLMQIGCILSFCRHLAHGERPARLDRLEARIIGGLRDFADKLAWTAGGGGRPLRRAEELAGALISMNLPEIAAPLLTLPPADDV